MGGDSSKSSDIHIYVSMYFLGSVVMCPERPGLDRTRLALLTFQALQGLPVLRLGLLGRSRGRTGQRRCVRHVSLCVGFLSLAYMSHVIVRHLLGHLANYILYIHLFGAFFLPVKRHRCRASIGVCPGTSFTSFTLIQITSNNQFTIFF